ncbi:protein roadkill-like [Trichogramma pretiosum]|uniref:protein roadkill-like n=1 Tax=Trichogramma pretiosum TaxID=7493 RepID=UPI0006C9E17F|nr:protein roadkill-like [Trichogramma pretiosum]
MTSKQRITASTTVSSDECIYTWTIKKYRSMKLEVGKSIESPKFGVGSDNVQYFQLELFPEGNATEYAGYMSLYLNPINISEDEPDKLVCRWTISVINDKKVVFRDTCHYDFTPDFQGYGWPEFYKVENVDQLISSENTVTIQCELEMFTGCESSLNSELIYSKNETVDRMKFDFSFLSEELSDVKLKSDEYEIPAHKIILATASPVFRAIFTNKKAKKNFDSIVITDIPYNILVDVLKYIYTGDIVSTKTDVILQILPVADKYKIDGLKTKCEKILSADLSTENVIKTLIAAHKHHLKRLETKVIKFITNHTELISNSEKITEIDDPDILVNLIQSLIKSQQD